MPDQSQPTTNERMLQQLMDNITDNIYFKDREGKFLLINRSFASWFNLSSLDEVIGKTDFDLFAEKHAAEAWADEQRIIHQGIPVIGKEEEETWRDGHSTWVSTTKHPLHDDQGNTVGLFGISRDITEHKLNELKLSAMHRQMAEELDLAREIQQSWLPDPRSQFPEDASPDTPRIEFTCAYQPSAAVGGDFFAVIPLSESRVGVFIADVIGHGVRAALLMSSLNALAHDAAPDAADPGEYLSTLNTRLLSLVTAQGSADFVTAFYLVADLATHRVQYASAGHHCPLVVRGTPAQARTLCDTKTIRGPALMMLPDAEFPVSEADLQPGDRLLLFTDGLFEVRLRGEERGQLGMEGMMEVLRRLPLTDPEGLVDGLIRGVLEAGDEEGFQDDVCLVELKVSGGPHISSS